MNKLKINLFGSLQLTIDKQPIAVRRRKVWALLAYLAVTDQMHQRDTLATMFWPEASQTEARAALTRHLSELKKILTEDRIIIKRASVRLISASNIWLDVRQFQQYVSDCHDPAPNCLDNLTAAIDLYQDDFMAGFTLSDCPDFDEWQRFQTEELRQQLSTTLERLIRLFHTQGDIETALSHARRWSSLDLLHEPAHRILMQLYTDSGQQAAALRQFQRLTELLQDELGITPSVETIALYEQIRSGQLGRGADVLGRWGDERQEQEGDNLRERESEGVETLGHKDVRERLPALVARPDQRLFGIQAAKEKLDAMLQSNARPWLISIDGIGGIGKTTLAALLTHDMVNTSRFVDIAWVSAKQVEFQPGQGIQSTGNAALDVETLTDELLQQLDPQANPLAAWAEKRATVSRLLKTKPHLVVVDNLETVVDYEAIVPYLRGLANPSKFFITSRFSLQDQADVFCLSLTELSKADAIAFLKYEADMRGIVTLTNADQAQLERIYSVVGGNPLALQLVMGQVRFLALDHVLNSLQEAQGKKNEALYNYIYWQAWHMLDDATRKLLLILPLEPNSSFDQLAELGILDPDGLQQSLSQLIALSLVQVSGDIEIPKYQLHRLTETFLLNEVLKW